jgi:hypothetical protein
MRRPDQPVSVTSACVPNIGTRGRTRRLLGGFGWSLATIAIFATFAFRDAPTAMFLVVAPFAGIAAVNFYQVKEKT